MPYSASTSLLYCDEKLEVMDTLQRRSTASSLAFSPPAGGEEVGVGLGAGGAAEKDFRTALNEFVNYKNSQKAGSDASGFSSGSISGGTSNSASSGAVTDSSGLWRKLQGLMEESGPNTSGSMTTRRNSEGGVERVIDLAQGTNPAITAYEKGGIFQDSSGEEVGGSSSSIIESLVLQSAKDIFGVSFVHFHCLHSCNACVICCLLISVPSLFLPRRFFVCAICSLVWNSSEAKTVR